jgi:hypothetical protein
MIEATISIAGSVDASSPIAKSFELDAVLVSDGLKHPICGVQLRLWNKWHTAANWIPAQRQLAPAIQHHAYKTR